MFLDEYGSSLRFQIYFKNQRELTVDIATKELESIIQKDPRKTEAIFEKDRQQVDAQIRMQV